MGEPRARRFIVSGRVQGVGYRYYAVRMAIQSGVTGWVRNLPGGGVEAHAEGSADALAAFEAALREGPRMSVVESVEVLEQPPGGGKGFHIRT